MEPMYKLLTQEEAVRAHDAGLEVFATPDHNKQWLPIGTIGRPVLQLPKYRYRVRADPSPYGDSETPEKEVDLLKAALVRCITIIQCSHGLTETEEWANSSKNMQRILAIDAVAGAKKALCGTPH